ncbi:hypothetical protein STEG23_014300 [Scotinomys teguina]
MQQGERRQPAMEVVTIMEQDVSFVECFSDSLAFILLKDNKKPFPTLTLEMFPFVQKIKRLQFLASLYLERDITVMFILKTKCSHMIFEYEDIGYIYLLLRRIQFSSVIIPYLQQLYVYENLYCIQ